jgi:MoaA/NifB/PqqE/SkfB family radical SAM enzyme
MRGGIPSISCGQARSRSLAIICRMPGLRCRHAFEYACVHANGEVVCSIIDGRGDFVLGNVHDQSLTDIVNGERARELRRLMLSTADSYCSAIGKRCALKSLPVDNSDLRSQLRFLAIEPTTACDRRCLACPVRDFSGDITWRDAYADGGLSFLLWDGLRRSKQHAADRTRRVLPMLATKSPAQLGRVGAMLMRGRTPAARRGTLPLAVLKRVISEAGPAIERVDFFNYGEPFLYRHLIDGLRHARATMPASTIAISTDGMQVRESVEETIVNERLLDWIVFSIDGCDPDSYRRYRIGGEFDIAFRNLQRFHRRAAGTGIHVVWQYVVFRWNDQDQQLRQAIAMAASLGLTLWFDFAHSWGRSRRRPAELRYLTPYLRPFTALPGQPRKEGW